MFLSLIKGDQPHVMVICGVVDTVKKLVEGSIVRTMPLNAVHISRVCSNIRQTNRNKLTLGVKDFNT